jgi:hypothetical protein
MTRRFILSASVAASAMADPAFAARVITAAQDAGLDLLLIGQTANLTLDPQVMAAWAAPRAGGLGIVPLVSIRIAHPFHTARALSAVDYLSGGMLGWCPVAEGGPAEQVADMVRATRALWDGWDEDCLIIDKASGHYLDSSKVRRSNYIGSYYRTRGPVNAMRPKQGHPLLVADADSPFAVLGVDVAIVREGQACPAAARGLRRDTLAADPAKLAGQFASGLIDGLHCDLAQPLPELAQMAQRFGALAGERATAGTLRERLGLPLPAVLAPQSAQEEHA